MWRHGGMGDAAETTLSEYLPEHVDVAVAGE
jgi:hypothetical protein